jgi:hypothetical protein
VVTRRRRAQATVEALLDAHGVALPGGASVVATVTDPRGKRSRVLLRQLAAGRYRATFAVPDPGLYTVHVVATGELDGQPFTRERVASIATVSGKPSDSKAPDEQPRKPKPTRRRKAVALDSLLKAAEPPEPLPEPEPVDPEALKHFVHMHAGPGGHFPSEAEVPPPEPWELEDKPKRGPKRKKPKPRSGGGGHEHPGTR